MQAQPVGLPASNPRSRSLLRGAYFFLCLFFGVVMGFVLHELAHYFAYRALGYAPIINWRYGVVSTYNAAGEPISESLLPPFDGILTSLAGPAVTLLLAAFFGWLYLRRRGSFLLFGIAIMNAVFRLNIFIDGFNSDEGGIAVIMSNSLGRLGRWFGLAPALVIWTTSLVISGILVRQQTFFRWKSYAAIAVWFLVAVVLTLFMRFLTTSLIAP
jgi:uncharacterized membrane protein